MSITLTGREIVKLLLDQNKWLLYVEEYHFAKPTRRWAFDFCVLDLKMAIEIEGGHAGNIVTCPRCRQKVTRRLKSGKLAYVREGGRHNSITGFRGDVEKYNAAAAMGWTVFRYTTDMLLENPMQVIDNIKARMKTKEDAK